MGKDGGISRRKQRFLFGFVAISVISTSLLCHVSAGGEDDSIMAKFAEFISPKPPGWTGTDPCKWTGIDCDSSGRVSSISIPSKSLSGELPSDLSQLSNLKTLNLQHNQFSGAAPSLTNLGNLQSVFFNDNNFTSVPSSFLSGLKNLQTFHISENPNIAPWTLPESLTDSSSLSTIFAARCGLTGTIPDIFGSFPNIQNIRLGYNNLTGPLPPSLANSGVQNLLVNDQDAGLSGWIDMIGTMSQLNQAWLHGNKFTGPIPDVSRCESLFDLQLRNNLLTGVIPPSLTSLPKLVNVSLQNNKFQGPVPSFPTNMQVNLGNTNKFCNPSPGPCDSQVTILLEIASALSYPMTLAESWEGNNPCKNWNFVTCDSSGSVVVINFGKQYWGGTISPSISKLTALKTLLLNDNKLNGTIPKSLTTLPQLTLIDITNNNISGKIPEFPSRVSLKTSGNPFIGIDLNGGGGLSTVAWVFIGIGGAALIVLLVFGFMIYGRRRRNRVGKYVRRKNDSEFDIDGGGMSDYGLISSRAPSQNSTDTSDFQVYDGGSFAFSIEVLRHATSNFREDNILGRGGFGVVYKGTLHDGTEIAVKRMEAAGAESTKGTNEFKAEIEVLSKVRHKNLVALLGSCVNGSERLLIYEYMPKGTLSQHLFEPVASVLNWKQRVTIALDVARGIEYLHTLAQQSFIHRDLKPSNILLGDDMRAKVSDFGLVKSAPDGKYSVETRLAGTFGYLAPEYATTGRVTTKIDVFAYGVVLMEIMTGRKALDETLPDEQCHLVSWFRRVIVNKGNIREHLDSNLEIDEETFDSISKVAELAGHCTAREPSNRPDMGHVVNVLSPLVQQWRPKRPEEEDSFGIDLRMSLPQALQRWQDDVSISTINTDLYSNTKSFK